MCLQTDKARVGIDTRRISADRIGRAALKPGRFLTVEANDVVLSVHLDFIAVPSLRREVLSVLVILLSWPRARRLILYMAPVRAKTNHRARRNGFAARFFVDLDFKSGMHCDESRVVRLV